MLVALILKIKGSYMLTRELSVMIDKHHIYNIKILASSPLHISSKMEEIRNEQGIKSKSNTSQNKDRLPEISLMTTKHMVTT